MTRKKYPSDHRRWFRVLADIGDKTANLTDAEFRAFILVLAEANEQRAQEKDESITVGTYRLTSIAPNKRGSNASATRVIRELCAKQTWELHEEDASLTIMIRNWSKLQGFAPANSVQTPATTPTPTTTPIYIDKPVPVEGKSKGPHLCPIPPDPEIIAKVAAHLEKGGTPRSACARKAEFAMDRVYRWSHGNGKKRTRWAMVICNGIDEGWALKGWQEHNTQLQARRAASQSQPETPSDPEPGFGFGETL